MAWSGKQCLGSDAEAKPVHIPIRARCHRASVKRTSYHVSARFSSNCTDRRRGCLGTVMGTLKSFAFASLVAAVLFPRVSSAMEQQHRWAGDLESVTQTLLLPLMCDVASDVLELRNRPCRQTESNDERHQPGVGLRTAIKSPIPLTKMNHGAISRATIRIGHRDSLSIGIRHARIWMVARTARNTFTVRRVRGKTQGNTPAR